MLSPRGIDYITKTPISGMRSPISSCWPGQLERVRKPESHQANAVAFSGLREATVSPYCWKRDTSHTGLAEIPLELTWKPRSAKTGFHSLQRCCVSCQGGKAINCSSQLELLRALEPQAVKCTFFKHTRNTFHDRSHIKTRSISQWI